MKTTSKLQELYQKRATFLEFGSEVPSALAAQIADAEKEMLQRELLPIIEDSALKALPPYGIDGKVLIAMEYNNRALTRIAISSDADKIYDFDVVKDISSEEGEPTTHFDPKRNNKRGKSDQRRSTSVGFSVRFANGKVIEESTANLTMIETLRYMGLERASHFTDETFCGFPLVGKNKRITEDGYNWQYKGDGWLIYTNMNNARKMRCLKGVAKMLHIPIVIKSEESET